MSEENVEFVRHGFELWNAASSDPEHETRRAAMSAMIAGYHPDAKIDFSRTLPDFPATGVTEAMSTWIESARGVFSDVRLQPTEIIDAGDAVVAGMRVTGKGSLSGVSIDAEVFYVFSFRDGQVAAAVTYSTRQEALAAVGRA